jgi:hypothetical protein
MSPFFHIIPCVIVFTVNKLLQYLFVVYDLNPTPYIQEGLIFLIVLVLWTFSVHVYWCFYAETGYSVNCTEHHMIVQL